MTCSDCVSQHICWKRLKLEKLVLDMVPAKTSSPQTMVKDFEAVLHRYCPDYYDRG